MIFKRKKKVEQVRLEPPAPKILREFKQYRLVEEFHQKVDRTTGKYLDTFENHLVLEAKDQNVMKEPFFHVFVREGNDYVEDKWFRMFRELFLDEKK